MHHDDLINRLERAGYRVRMNRTATRTRLVATDPRRDETFSVTAGPLDGPLAVHELIRLVGLGFGVKGRPRTSGARR